MQQPTTVKKPEGGFIFISVRQMCRAWVAYQQRLIRIVDLWVWFAAHELVARRCQVQRGQPVHYRVEELTDLVSGTHSMVSSLHKLARANLLHWHDTKLTFPDDRSTLSDSAAVRAMLEQITNHHRLIPVPRRLIRYLAGGCHRVMVATIMGHLLRCLYYRDGGCRPQGHCKATWIAQVFGVSVRQVKQNRKMLESIDLLQRNSTPQWVLNRYGQTMTVNLRWHEPVIDATFRAWETEDYLMAVTEVKSEVAIAVETIPVPETLSIAIYTTDTLAEDHLTPISGDLRKAEAQSAPQPDQELHTPAPSPTRFTSVSAPISDPLTEIVAPLLAALKIAPRLPTKRPPLAPPLFNSELSANEKDQKPADSPASGVLTAMYLAIRSALHEGRLSPTEENPIVIRTASTPPHYEPTATSSPSVSTRGIKKTSQEMEEPAPLIPPTLRNISLHDLRNTKRLLQLYTQAVKAGLIDSSEAARLAFVALAQHVVAYRPDNAGGLFTQLLRKRHFDYITQDNEDTALRRLKRHFQDTPPPVLQPVVETVLRKTG